MIEVTGVAIGRGLSAALPALTVAIAGLSVIPVETEERPMLVSLVIGGRLKADSGSVTLDGRADAAALRRAVALVDTPFVAEPAAGIRLRTVVAEELSFAGRGSRDFLAEHGLSEYAKVPVGVLPPHVRIRLLVELALLRPGVSAIVLTSPERHGGDPAAWFSYLRAVADRGITVAVVTDVATANLVESL